jgi:hypothetical protein
MATCSRRACGLITFSVDLAHQIDFQVPLGHKLLQLGVFDFEGFQALDVLRLQSVEVLAPTVDGLFADLVLLGDLGNAAAISLAQHGNDLLVGESALPFF